MLAPRTIQARLDRLSRWHRWALAGWALVLLILCTRAFADPRSHNVYLNFANAGRNWLHGDTLYGAPPADCDVFRYSPGVAALFVPFGVLPDRVGGVLWRLLNAAVSLVALTWWGRATLPASLGRYRQVMLWVLVFPACVANLHNGQSNPLVLALVLAAVAGAAEERWNLVAACIAAAALFKVYPLALGLLLVVIYPRQLARRLALAVTAGLALPLLLQAPGYVLAQYADWVAYLRVDDRCALPLEFWPRDLRLLCRAWLGPMPAGLYLALQLLTALAAAGLCLAAQRQGCPKRRLLALLTGLGCCWMTVLGPATEANTYLLLCPPLAAALLEAWQGGRPRWTFWGYALALSLLLLAGLCCWFPGGKVFGQFGPHPLAGLLTLGCLVGDALPVLRAGRTATDGPALGWLGGLFRPEARARG